ncbi:MAG: EF-hand domain-containing protein [Methyloligella sp. ZOD6]
MKFVKLIPVAGAALMLSTAVYAAEVSETMKAVDPDMDNEMTLKEAQTAGKKVFKAINPDGDDTLEADELKGRVTKRQLKEADPDDDGSLDMNEYMNLIEKRFHAANPDGDDTIESDELETRKGKKLLELIQE